MKNESNIHKLLGQTLKYIITYKCKELLNKLLLLVWIIGYVGK